MIGVPNRHGRIGCSGPVNADIRSLKLPCLTAGSSAAAGWSLYKADSKRAAGPDDLREGYGLTEGDLPGVG